MGAVISLLLVGLIVHVHAFFNPVILVVNDGSGVLSWALGKYCARLHPVSITVIYFVLIFLQAFRLNLILNNNKMFAKAAFTVAFSYVLLSALIFNATALSAALIVNTVIIWLVRNSFKLYNNQTAKTLIFNLGFCVSFLALLYYPCVVLFLAVIVFLAVLRPFRATEWFVFLLGIFTPFYLMVAAFFLTNNMHLLHFFTPKIKIVFAYIKTFWAWYYLIVMGLLLLVSLAVWYPNSSRMVIQIRKNWVSSLMLLLFLLGSVLAFYNSHYSVEVLTIIPIAAFAGNLFLYPKNKLLSYVLLIAIIVLIVRNNLEALKLF